MKSGMLAQAADRIVLDRALRLRAVQRVVRDLDFAEGVAFVAHARQVRISGSPGSDQTAISVPHHLRPQSSVPKPSSGTEDRGPVPERARRRDRASRTRA